MKSTSPSYSPAFYLKNGHLGTIIPYFLRPLKTPAYKREKVNLPDKDWVYLDWVKRGSSNLILLLHGLEGCSLSNYVRGLIQNFSEKDFDFVVFNQRGCVGGPNKFLRSYHSGKTEDLHSVLNHLVDHHSYQRINIIGFSLGGNILLKYLGDQRQDLHKQISKAVAVSAPCDLKGSAIKINEGFSKIYGDRFLGDLRKKLKAKEPRFINEFDFQQAYKVKSLIDFDHIATAPLNGFKDAWDYYDKASSLPVLENIQLPTMIISAQDDPFISIESIPFEKAEKNKFLSLSAPKHGGHIGFMHSLFSKAYFHEGVIQKFLL